MKKWLSAALAVLMITGCTQASSGSSASSASSAETPKNIHDEYPGVPEDNAFVYAESGEAVLNMLEHGTGIVFLGFDECPFCQAYAPMMNEVAAEAGVPVLYYDILQDRSDNTEFYQNVVKDLEGHLDFDNEGNPRVYVPDVTFVVRGEIIEHDNETSMLSSKEISPEKYWTDERVSALKAKLSAAAQKVAQARKENDEKGCDEGCEYDPTAPDAAKEDSTLVGLLKTMDETVHPGVMGGQIKSVSSALAIMDLYLDEKLSADVITASMKKHMETEDDLDSFIASMDLVRGSADVIADGEVDPGILEDAGYTSEIRWNADDVKAVFDALYAGVSNQ